ncbi:Wtm1 [Kluyveromyces lactis]|nr:Wtm1 [Kluyveromyces lactis]
MATDIRTNKVKNEEFKIWKKTIPSLYEHISTLQPKIFNPCESSQSPERRVLFTDLISEEADKGLLNTSIYYSQRSEIYEIGVQLPIGAYTSHGDKELPQPRYSEFFSEPANAKWVFEGHSIASFKANHSTSALIVMSKRGTLAWYNGSSKKPLKSLEGSSEKDITADFDISTDGKYVVRFESPVPESAQSGTKITVINNTDNVGDVLHTITLPNTKQARCVKFHTTTLFSTVTEDNLLRFWDVRARDEMLFSLSVHSVSSSSESSTTESEVEDDGTINVVEASKLFDTLFITGSDAGVIKLWDLRSIAARNSKEVKDATEIVTFYQLDNDPVVDIQFSPLEPECFLTVGASGNVYHWDFSYLINESEQQGEDAADSDEIYQDDIQEHSLKFLHTGGGRRSAYKPDNTVLIKGSVTQHPLIRDIIGTVDGDGYLTVYKGFYGRDGEIAESE